MRRRNMRFRRIVTFSVLIYITTVGFSISSFTTTPTNPRVNFKEAIESLVELITPKPTTIFDPPMYSIDEADSLWVIVNKARPLPDLDYQPETLAVPSFPAPKIQNPYGLKLRQEAAFALEQLAAAMGEAGKGTLILNSGFRTYQLQQELHEKSKATKGLELA